MTLWPLMLKDRGVQNYDQGSEGRLFLLVFVLSLSQNRLFDFVQGPGRSSSRPSLVHVSSSFGPRPHLVPIPSSSFTKLGYVSKILVCPRDEFGRGPSLDVPPRPSDSYLYGRPIRTANTDGQNSDGQYGEKYVHEPMFLLCAIKSFLFFPMNTQ